jgi:hypothetical protein
MGQCHKIFCVRFFSQIISLQAPENNIGVTANIFENVQRYWQVRRTIGINNTGSKFATGVNNAGGK